MKKWSADNIESETDTADYNHELRLLDNFLGLVNAFLEQEESLYTF